MLTYKTAKPGMRIVACNGTKRPRAGTAALAKWKMSNFRGVIIETLAPCKPAPDGAVKFKYVDNDDNIANGLILFCNFGGTIEMFEENT